MSRKDALLILVGVYVVGQSLGALATGCEMMFVTWVVTGVASSAFFGVALATCADLVGPDLRGRASSIVLGGLLGLASPLWVGAGLALLALISLLPFLREPKVISAVPVYADQST
ncbi:hypothetical protein [Parasphingorhabdus pacifica]